MQNMLRPVYTIFSLTAAILIWVGSSTVLAQISLSDGSPVEIRFSDESGIQSSTSRIVFHLSELSRIISPEFGEVPSEWKLYNQDHSDISNTYIRDERQFVSVGRFQSGELQSPLFNLSFTNLSSYDFGGLMVAFDFVAYSRLVPPNRAMILLYKVNEGEWQKTESGLLNTNNMRDDSRQFSTVSVQINLSQIFLRNDDQIHFIWVSDGEDTEDVPVFLQRIEVFPEISRTPKLERGSLIITEIMPVSNVDGTDFEYLELYNPGNEEIRLKGVEIKTSLGSHIIQKDISVPPYSMIVVSNVDISGINGISNSYFFQGNLIPETGGRIEIVQQSTVVAAATYESSENGVALQLNEMIHAYDGYTSMAHLVPAEESFFPELTGSPGKTGRTLPFYRRSLVQDGWYLIAPPGKMNARLSRHSSLQFFTIDGEPASPELFEPHEPFFIYKNNREPVMIYAEAIQGIGNITSPFSEFTMAGGLRLTSSVYPSADHAARIMSSSGIQVPPLVKSWDERAQTFRLMNTEDVTLVDWTPIILPGQTDVAAAGNSAGSRGLFDISRNISFTLFEGEGNSQRLLDRAVLGFLNQPENDATNRFDLPKIVPAYRSQANSLEGMPFIYLSSPESKEPYNSFIHLPYDIREDYSIALGYQLTPEQTSGQAILEWRIPADIPDEWIILLKDNQTGLSMNMREENSYRFRYNIIQNQQVQDERFVVLSAAAVSDRNRFSVELQPFEIVEEIAEEARPGSIELRQNFPNPFNPSTNITFYLPEDRTVRVGIYNIVGQQVAMLVDDNLQAGEHSVRWDASNNPSGIYIVQLETGNRILTRKITLIK
jgi:hypothetical protein